MRCDVKGCAEPAVFRLVEGEEATVAAVCWTHRTIAYAAIGTPGLSVESIAQEGCEMGVRDQKTIAVYVPPDVWHAVRVQATRRGFAGSGPYLAALARWALRNEPPVSAPPRDRSAVYKSGSPQC